MAFSSGKLLVLHRKTAIDKGFLLSILQHHHDTLQVRACMMSIRAKEPAKIPGDKVMLKNSDPW